MVWKRLAFLVTSILFLRVAGNPTQAQVSLSREQSVFGMEMVPVAQPVVVPEDVLQILRKNDYVLTCLKGRQTPNDIPASWFVGSRIHLDGPDEADLVVLPANECLLGANVAPFWVFRGTPRGFELVLDISVHDLRILKSRSNGYRDIETWSSTAVTHTTLHFKFNGTRYELTEKKNNPESDPKPGDLPPQSAHEIIRRSTHLSS